MPQMIIDLSKIINLPDGKYLNLRTTNGWKDSWVEYAHQNEVTTDLKSFLNDVFDGQPKPNPLMDGDHYTKQAQQLAHAINQRATCYGYGADWSKAYKNATEKLRNQFRKLAPHQYSNFNAYKWTYLGPVTDLTFTKIKFANDRFMYFILK